MNLTDDEMRVKIAEAMGWTFEWMDAHNENKNVTIRRPGGWLVGRFYVSKLPPCILAELPNYPASVDAALTLCDRLREEGGECFIDNSVGVWRCHFMNVALDINVWLEDPSLARAICQAFLKVKDSGAHSL